MKNLIAVLALLLAPSLAHAVLFNGNFEVGLTGWSTMGDVLTVDSSFGVGPPQGHLQVLLTTAPDSSFCSVLFCPEHQQTYSGTNAVSDVSPSVFLFFGFQTGLGFFLPFHLQEASGIRQSFDANTDILISFTWKFVTDDGDGSSDPRFYVLDGITTILNPSTPIILSPTPFAREYGYETTSIFIPAGFHTLAFGITDDHDNFLNSGLLVDDISFRAVPEPPALLLLGFGLICIAVVFRKKH